MAPGVESAVNNNLLVEMVDQLEEYTPEKLRGNIPVIDFAEIDGPERENISRQIAKACETWGFFHLINHGIDKSLLIRAKEASTEFFQGPEEEKWKVRLQMPHYDGWNHSKNAGEGNGLNQKDSVEHLFNYFYPEREEDLDRFPQHPASYRRTLLEYCKELKCLGEKFMVILSETLGLAPDALHTALIAGTVSQSIQITMRTNFYGLKENGEALSGICHAHTDPGFLTFLLADEAPGLEIQNDGQWVKVEPIPGALICNVGDVLEVCSNGKYKSGWHKGMPSRNRERITLANFQLPAYDALLGPMPALLDESHPAEFRNFTYAEYIGVLVKVGLGERHLLGFKL